MMTYSGIDVSEHNGIIDWQKVKPHISFAMIRAGYGSKTLDEKFKTNVMQCVANKIPFGVYWFSYACTVEMAVKEARKCINAVKPFMLSLPIAYDFEYDSLEYAKKQGIIIDGKLMSEMAKAFLEEVKAAGYEPMLYTNPDFWNRGFKKLGRTYPIWCAQWGVSKPSLYCDIWQDGIGTVEGISTNVDMNVSYKLYPLKEKEKTVQEKIEEVNKKYCDKYEKIADDVIAGKYGNGNARKAKLISENLDPSFVQDLVNAKVAI